ncbi:MAG: MarR family transcriptional regulator [Solirubrobacterales bacterium]|nr:MarR family transcriptional regulator [Solirubrobacterales bacterium]
MELTDDQFAQLLALRTGLRRFLHWSEEQARAAGLTPAQHQLLLAIRGHEGSEAPSVGDIAEHLLLRHHSASELVDRAEAAGLVRRHSDPDNAAVVRVALTPLGEEKLGALTSEHLRELAQLGPTIRMLWRSLEHSAT